MRMLKVRMASCGIGFMVGFLFAAAVSIADEIGKPARSAASHSEWLQAPSTQGAMTPPDAAARQELLQSLDEDQGDEFRQAYKTAEYAAAESCPTN